MARRSDLWLWMRDNFDAFRAELRSARDGKGVDWTDIRDRMAAKGKTRPDMKPEHVRVTWWRVRKWRRANPPKLPAQPPRVTEHASPQPAVPPPDKPQASGGLAALDILKRERFD